MSRRGLSSRSRCLEKLAPTSQQASTLS
jgi:hypothetical protein